MRLRRKIKILGCFIMCAFLVFVLNVSAYAQTVKVQENITTDDKYVTARVIIGNGTSTSSNSDANADVNADGVRLRSGPSQDYSVLELMYYGEYVRIDFTTSYSQSDGTWYYVKRIKTGTWGWVKAEYIYYWD